jgi:hypothetical protein
MSKVRGLRVKQVKFLLRVAETWCLTGEDMIVGPVELHQSTLNQLAIRGMIKHWKVGTSTRVKLTEAGMHTAIYLANRGPIIPLNGPVPVFEEVCA